MVSHFVHRVQEHKVRRVSGRQLQAKLQIKANNAPGSRERNAQRPHRQRGLARSLSVLCRPAIGDLFQPETEVRCLRAIAVLCLRANAQVDRVRASRCVLVNLRGHSKVAQAAKAVPILRDPQVPEDLAVLKIVLMVSAPVQFLPARDRVRASLGVPACFPLRLPTKCRRRPNPASRSTLVVPRNASAPRPISGRWRANASFIQHGSVPAQVTDALRFLSLRLNRALLAISTSLRASPFANSPKNSTCARKIF